MHSIAHYAAAIILTSALGAFVLCLLVIRYGFTPADDEPLRTRHRRFFVTRLGHAVGAVCFAITAALAGVTLSMASRTPAPPAPAASAAVDVAPLRAGHARLAHDVRTLDERIERAEAALAELRAASRRAAVIEPVPRPPRRATRVSRPDAADVRTPVPPPAVSSEGESAAAIPRQTTDFSAPTPSVPAPPAAPKDARRPAELVRSAADGVARLGTELRKKATIATRAVRDFFRDL